MAETIRAAALTYTNDGFVIATWTGLDADDAGAGLILGGSYELTVQATGTFGAGGNVALQGSNDGTTWGAMPNPGGTTIGLGDAVPDFCAIRPRYVRPKVTAGDGTTDLTVTLVAQRRRS